MSAQMLEEENHHTRFRPSEVAGFTLRHVPPHRTGGACGLSAVDVAGIWTVDIDGGNAKKLLAEVDPSVPDGAFWSPDGKQIAIVLFDWQFKNSRKVGPNLDPGAHRIEIMDADGTNRRPIPLKGEKLFFISSMGDWR